jgi:hypothetical protein
MRLVTSLAHESPRPESYDIPLSTRVKGLGAYLSYYVKRAEILVRHAQIGLNEIRLGYEEDAEEDVDFATQGISPARAIHLQNASLFRRVAGLHEEIGQTEKAREAYFSATIEQTMN